VAKLSVTDGGFGQRLHSKFLFVAAPLLENVEWT